jgi:hypothetical protein
MDLRERTIGSCPTTISGVPFTEALFRPGGKAAGNPPFDASDVTDEWERELLERWWREAALTDPAVRGPDARTKLITPNIVQRALLALSQSSFFAGLAERALIFDLKTGATPSR